MNRTFLATVTAVCCGTFVMLVARPLAGVDLSGSAGKPPAPRTADARGSAAAPTAPDTPAKSRETAVRQREGSLVTDEPGEFQKSGDRYSFYPESGKGVLRVLENLALERITSQLGDGPAPKVWIVSGTLTEYRGENYLLVTRAVLKRRGTMTGPAAAAAGSPAPRAAPAASP